MTNSIQDIMNEVKATRGKEVRIFGQPTVLSEDVEKGYVDILDILEKLKGYEVDMLVTPTYDVREDEREEELELWAIYDSNDEIVVGSFVTEDEALEHRDELEAEDEEATESIDKYLAYLEDLYIIEDKRADNSYNWNGRVSNHFNFFPYENKSTGEYLVEFKVHLYGDVRGNYTKPVLLKFDSDYEFLEIIAEQYTEDINDDYYANFSATGESIEIFTQDGEYVDNAYDWDEAEEKVKELEEQED